jgi:hypothetical protein
MIDTEKVVEILRCAEVNCDNVVKGGAVFAQIVKAQIQEAIEELEGEIVTDDVLAPRRTEEENSGN